MNKIVRICLLIAMSQFLLFISSSVFGQKLKPEVVPDDVRQGLEFEHPSAKVSAWNLEDDIYMATFKEDGASGKAYFDKEGNWLKSTFSIPKNELPPAVRDYLNGNYPLSSIVVSLLQATPEERMHYYIEMKPDAFGVANSVLTFNDMGNLINRKDPEEKVAPVVEKPVKEKKEVEEKPTTQKESKPVAVKEPAPAKSAKKSKAITDEFGNEAIPETAVPELVKKELLKKAQRPEELNWFKIDDYYVAKCIYRDQKNEIFITPEGKWDKTHTYLPATSVSGNMAKHLNSFYNGWKFKQAVKETRADKNDKTLVELYEKKNIKSKLVTTAIFDKTGKLLRSIEPDATVAGSNGDENLSDKMEMALEKDPSEGVPGLVINAFKAKYPRIANPEWKESEEGDYMAIYMGARGKEVAVIGQSGTILQTQTLGRMDLIPATIESYIKKNHKGYKVDEYYAVKDLLEKKNYYKVFVSNKKTKEEKILWFTTSGQIVER